MGHSAAIIVLHLSTHKTSARRACSGAAAPWKAAITISLAPPGSSAAAVVLAAGSGARMGLRGKLWVRLGGSALLRHSLTPFEQAPGVSARVLVVALSELSRARRALARWGVGDRWLVVAGGASRQSSEAAGVVAALTAAPPLTRVLVHDASRPFVRAEELDALLGGGEHATTLAWPARGPVVRVRDGGQVLGVLPGMWALQTPQAFPAAAFAQAHFEAARKRLQATDGIGVWLAAGGRARVVTGSPWNLKVTTPADLLRARRWLPLWRAGVAIPPRGGGWAGT